MSEVIAQSKFQRIFAADEWSKIETAVREGAQPKQIDDEWLKAIHSILFSKLEILCIGGAMEHFAVSRYHLLDNEEDAEATWVSALSAADGTVQASYPHIFGDMVGLLDGLIDFDGPAAPLQCSFKATPGEVSVLLALADVLRSQYLQSFLERRAFAARAITEEEITQTLRQGLSSQDTRWWVTCGAILFPFSLIIDSGEIKDSLDLLCEQQLIKRENDGFLPLSCGDFLASLLTPLSAFSLTVMAKSQEALPFAMDTVIGVRTATTFWTLNFSHDENGPLVHVVSSQALMLLTYLYELIDHYLREARQRVESVLPGDLPPEFESQLESQCDSQSQKSERGSESGESVRRSEESERGSQKNRRVICTFCSFDNDERMNFCGGCGHSLYAIKREAAH